MSLPGVKIIIGNGGLGRTAITEDGVAGLIVTGAAVAGKLELNKPYTLASTRDMVSLGITAETNFLAHKDITAFYAAAGEGAELHLMVVAEATTLTAMCTLTPNSPLCRLIDSAAGRIRLVGVNKIASAEEIAENTQGIDKDTVTAVSAAHLTAESYAKNIAPFRVFVAAPAFDETSEDLFKPREAGSNRSAVVLASDDTAKKTAAVGMVLGRAAKAEPQQSLGRVKDGAIAAKLYLTNGKSHTEMVSMAATLHDAGYIIPISYPTKNGAYLNGNPMASSIEDDYSELNLGRVIDKAMIVAYNTYISEIMDNILISEDGTLAPGICVSYSGMLENAVMASMAGQVSSFSVSIDSKQNVLSSGVLEIQCKIVPLATLQQIVVNLAFENPALKSVE